MLIYEAFRVGAFPSRRRQCQLVVVLVQSEPSAFMYLHHSRMRSLTPSILFTADSDEAFPLAL